MTESERDGQGLSQRRVRVEVKKTRVGSIVTIRDPSGGSGIRAPSDAERAALDSLNKVKENLDTDAHDHGDHVADIVVEDDGECSVKWCSGVVRLAADGGKDESGTQQEEPNRKAFAFEWGEDGEFYRGQVYEDEVIVEMTEEQREQVIAMLSEGPDV